MASENVPKGPVRILLADEHTLLREGLRLLFERQADLTITAEAACGAQTIALTRQLQPDILLLGLSLPHVGGFDVARALNRTAPATRIVVLAGQPDPHHVPVLLQVGVRGYLSKAVTPLELFGALRVVHSGRLYVQPEFAMVLSCTAGAVIDGTPTLRELEVLSLAAEGLRNRQIGARLCISERTVRFHLSGLSAKLHAASRTELVHLARGKAWVT